MAESFAGALLAVRDSDRPIPDEPLAWLLTIARNKLIDSIRHGRVEQAARDRLALAPLEIDDEDIARIEDAAASVDVAASIDGLLSADEHAVLKARIVDERDYADIARESVLLRGRREKARQPGTPDPASRPGDTRMSGYLDRFEQQLIDATNVGRSRSRGLAARHRRFPASLAIALAALLAASAVALAVTGTFGTGSPVRPSQHPSARAGVGIATRGTRLLAMRVADPAGGLPWGMRLVRTTRRLVCLQVGRIDGAELGVLGEDGAFADDEHFHPVTPDVVGYHSTTTEISTCLPPGQTTSLEARLPQSGVFGSPDAGTTPAAARRWISYGLLGPEAVSVTYTSAGQTRTIPVEPGSGAYLVVLPNPAESSFETGGGASSANPLVVPQGVISSIAYRMNGRLCHESRPANEAAAAHPGCHRPPAAAPPGAARRLHRPIRARLSADGTASVTFTAPHTVTSALSDYTVEVPSPCHEGIDVTPVERDLQAGETVHVAIHNIFTNACGPTITIRVLYEKTRNRFLYGEREVIVGETSIRR